MKEKNCYSLSPAVLNPLRAASEATQMGMSTLIENAIRHALIHGFIRNHEDGVMSVTQAVSDCRPACLGRKPKGGAA